MNHQSKEISRYQDGVRQVLSPQIATALGLPDANTITIGVAQYVAIPQGKDYVPNGSFLQDNFTGQMVQYSDGIFRSVSQQVAGILKLQQSQIIKITDEQYRNLIKPSQYYPDGIFIENLSTGDISYYSGGQLHWLSPAVVATVKPPLSNTVIETAANYSVIPRGSDYTPPAST
jgi:hypothetical protein